MAFTIAQRKSQGIYLQRTIPDKVGYRGAGYRLFPGYRDFNLAPHIRELADAYFAEKGITWHQHANHGLSSQVCCLNFLMPLAHDPGMLSKLVGRALEIEPPDMLPMERDGSGRDWFVAFEWIGERDYLNEANEAGSRTRGANATSSDAAVRFKYRNKVEIALIEWKYSEAYGAPIPSRGNPTREARYRDLAFGPIGPVRADLGLALSDFFWEPFYQMLRQQMLASQMQKHSELGAERVRVLHISPKQNLKLHYVIAPRLRQFGNDAFEVFRCVLTEPSAFVSWSIEGLFSPLIESASDPWSAYLMDRYAFLNERGEA